MDEERSRLTIELENEQRVTLGTYFNIFLIIAESDPKLYGI